jgi:endo-1,4-beta-xylanase
MQIQANITVSDICDPNPTVRLISIASNEPDNDLADGNTTNDIQGAALGTDDRQFFLRAERSALGNGRIYTISYEARDQSGNTTLGQVTVKVPLEI